ncbi:APC family permease [Rhodococcus sp. IEGM1428]|uniref:APC family permease n=1 Tax=Rhodococcus sp. IEGM1428 TaxID=3392191 RepID=UPI003D144A39
MTESPKRELSDPLGAPTADFQRGAVGTHHLVFFIVAAAAPLTILAGFAPLALGVAGASLPVAYLIPGGVYLLFAVGFTAMSRHFHGAGAFYAYISEGLSHVVGAGAAMLAYLGYLGGQTGFVLSCGIFASTALNSIFGFSPSVYACALLVSVAVGIIGYRRVDLGARVLVVLLSLELAILAVFCVAVLVRGGHEGIEFSSFSPDAILAGGVASAFVVTFTSFVGFEQAAIYSEECKDPRKTVSRATYIGVALLTFVYAFCSWVIVQAVGLSKLADVLSGDPSALVFTLNSEFAGEFMTEAMRLLIVTSFFAGCLALHNACTRYLFALGGTKILPAALVKISPVTKTPSTAGIVQVVLVSAILLIFSITPTDPYLQVVVWTNTPTIIAVLALQVLASLAVIGYFRKNAHGESAWSRVIAPWLSVIALSISAAYLIFNMSALTQLGVVGNSIIVLPLVLAFAVGAGRALIVQRTNQL